MAQHEHRIDLRPGSLHAHLEEVRQAVASLDEDDAIHLIAPRMEAEQLDPFIRIFEASGLGYQPKGGHDGAYHLYASRGLPRPAPGTGPDANT